MSKFLFSLETVYRFKNQVLNGLLGEMSLLVQEKNMQQAKVEDKKQEILNLNQSLNKKSQQGISVPELTCYKEFLKRAEKELFTQEEILRDYTQQLEQKAQQVLSAKQESRSLEQLKEQKLQEYQKEQAKKQTMLLEEFVVNTLSCQNKQTR